MTCCRPRRPARRCAMAVRGGWADEAGAGPEGTDRPRGARLDRHALLPPGQPARRRLRLSRPGPRRLARDSRHGAGDRAALYAGLGRGGGRGDPARRGDAASCGDRSRRGAARGCAALPARSDGSGQALRHPLRAGPDHPRLLGPRRCRDRAHALVAPSLCGGLRLSGPARGGGARPWRSGCSGDLAQPVRHVQQSRTFPWRNLSSRRVRPR